MFDQDRSSDCKEDPTSSIYVILLTQITDERKKGQGERLPRWQR